MMNCNAFFITDACAALTYGNMGDAIGDDARILRRAGHAVDAEPDRGG